MSRKESIVYIKFQSYKFNCTSVPTELTERRVFYRASFALRRRPSTKEHTQPNSPPALGQQLLPRGEVWQLQLMSNTD